MERVFLSQLAAQKGTDLHNLAAELIRLKVNLPETSKTMNLYVNDCIGFRMSPEVVLFYSPTAFGTTDAIGFSKNILRISDLKTGVTPTGPRQLEVYCAYFCLEYGVNPFDIQMELRIYQNDECREYETTAVSVSLIMEKIKQFDKRISEMREELM